MTGEHFTGATVALVTPFDRAGRVDESALRSLVDWQVEEGIDALLAAGTTGEAATMTAVEQLRTIQVVIEQAHGRVPVLAGTGSNSTAETVELTRAAAEHGCDGVLVVGPYYNKPTQSGFREHFKAVAEAVSLPVILYNVPGRTGSNISAETVLSLAAVPNIVGIKEASGDLTQVMRIIRNRPEGFVVLSGDDALTLPLIALGGEGTISVVANQVPGPFSEMVAAARRGNWERARQLHYQLLALMELNFVESNPIPVKAGLAMMGKLEENYRLPLVPIGNANRAKLREALQQLGIVSGD